MRANEDFKIFVAYQSGHSLKITSNSSNSSCGVSPPLMNKPGFVALFKFGNDITNKT